MFYLFYCWNFFLSNFTPTLQLFFFLLTFEPYLENISNLSSQSLTAFTYGVVGMDDYPIDVHILRTMKIGFSEPSQFL